MLIQIVLFEGFDELDAIGPFEVLQMAVGADWRVELVTLDGAAEVRGARGLVVRPGGGRLAEGARPDLVVVPGGGWNDRSARGAWAQAQRGELPRLLASLHEAGVVLASVCTGALLLAEAGVLRGRPAVTHRGALEDLRARGAEVKAARVVDDGEVVTAGGVTAGLDLGLWLVERWLGAEAARRVAERLEYERRGEVWRR